LRHGAAFAERLRGMFAFALWDRRERRLLLARDRFGIKPLYYSLAGGRLTFASELKALLRDPLFPRAVDTEALHSFLAFNSVPAHLLADVPVGVLLSGGVDSSVLTALAARESSEQVATFSIGFRERSFNELDLARQVAQRYGTNHHELVLSPRIEDLLPRLVA